VLLLLLLLPLMLLVLLPLSPVRAAGVLDTSSVPTGQDQQVWVVPGPVKQATLCKTCCGGCSVACDSICCCIHVLKPRWCPAAQHKYLDWGRRPASPSAYWLHIEAVSPIPMLLKLWSGCSFP
jgi:hypothetical protein